MRSVLLVDDVVMVRHLLRLVLESTGQFVVVGEAGDGDSAVAAAGELRPDVVLLDLSMPGMDGLEALPLIRAACPGALVVVNSGFAAQRAEQSALEAGAAGYLEKGLEPRQVVERLLEIVSGGEPPGNDGRADDACQPDRLDRVLASMAGLTVGDESTWWEPILEGLRDGVLVVTAAGQLQAWNAAAQRILDARAASGDVVGHGIDDLGWLVRDGDGPPVGFAVWIADVAQRPTRRTEARLVRGNDRLELHAVAAPGRNGTIDGVVITVSDDRDAQELDHAVRHAHAVSQLVRDAVVVVDAAGLIQQWNNNAAQIFGWEAAEITGRPLATLFAPGHVVEVDAMIASARLLLTSAGRAVTAVARDGGLLDVSVGTAPATGDGAFVTVVIEDVAVRVRTSLALERAEREVRCLHTAIGAAAGFERAGAAALSGVLAGVGLAVEAQFVQLWTRSTDDRVLQCAPDYWSSCEEFAGLRQISEAVRLMVGVDGPGCAWERGDVVVDRFDTESRGPRLDAARDAGATNALFVPLKHGNEVVAVLEVFGRSAALGADRTTTLVQSVGAIIAPVLTRGERRMSTAL